MTRLCATEGPPKSRKTPWLASAFKSALSVSEEDSEATEEALSTEEAASFSGRPLSGKPPSG